MVTNTKLNQLALNLALFLKVVKFFSKFFYNILHNIAHRRISKVKEFIFSTRI